MNRYQIPIDAFGINPLLLTDYYNFGHEKLKINTDWEISNMFNRNQPMILFGLNWTVIDILNRKITTKMVREAEEKVGAKRFNADLWYRVIDECGAYIPLSVEAVPDGTWVPKGTAFASVANTVEGFGELVSWFEGAFMHCYFPSNCATEAFLMRKYLDSQKLSEWRIHSFGWRAQRSIEDAIWANLAWHLSLPGADDCLTYGFIPKEVPKGSIPASAHKTTQQFDNELYAYMHQIQAMREAGETTYSMVIDTFNAQRFISDYFIHIAEEAKLWNHIIVFRPDSGDTVAQVIQMWEKLKPYPELMPHVAFIIGDGMDFEKIKEADTLFKAYGVPLEKVSYGVGSGYFKRFHRDELGWAMKTVYSNNKDRIKLAEDKTSIPGIVGLQMVGKFMTMMTTEERNKMGFRDGESLYQTIYNYDGYAPYETYEQSYLDIYNRVRAQTGEQEACVITDGLKAKIEVMKKELLS